jgi:hypothetical protein
MCFVVFLIFNVYFFLLFLGLQNVLFHFVQFQHHFPSLAAMPNEEFTLETHDSDGVNHQWPATHDL